MLVNLQSVNVIGLNSRFRIKISWEIKLNKNEAIIFSTWAKGQKVRL